MSERADLLASLFETDVSTNLDDNSEPSASFEERCKDIKSVMEESPIPETEMVKPKKTAETKDDTDKMIQEAIKDSNKNAVDFNENKNIEIVEENEIEPEEDTEIEIEDEDSPSDLAEDEAKIIAPISGKLRSPVDCNVQINPDNPLGLIGEDLRAYKTIKEKYPQFTLYTGNPIYRDFYTYKVKVLKNVLTKFPILNLKEYRKEVRDADLDHYVGDKVIDPELVRRKLDDCYRCRIRVVSLLSLAYEQSSSWERFAELLRSKLYKEHDLKGAHKREGLVLEHMGDIEDYVGELKGFVQQAKYIDSLFLAAAESLSRQLTCIQFRQPSVGRTEVEHALETKRVVPQKAPDKKLEHLDTIEDGEVVSAPKNKPGVAVVDMGTFDTDDDLAGIGIK